MQKKICTSLLLLLGACSTAPTVTNVKDLESSAPEKQRMGILLAVDLDTGGNIIAEDGCTLYLAPRGEMIKDFRIEIKPGKTNVVADLPEGVYKYKTLYCGSTTWTLSWDRANFQVFAGKISLLDNLLVKIINTRHASLQKSDRNLDREAALELFKGLSKPNQASVVSGYTGQGIEPAQIASPSHFKTWDYYVDGSSVATPNSEKDWPKFRECYRAERKTNQLWLGSADFDVNYDHSNFVDIKQKESWNTFTPAFLECAKAKLKEFIYKIRIDKVRSEWSYHLYKSKL